MAAVDYARFATTLPRARLLFVAHREEILEQSLATFRHALRDARLRRAVGRRPRPRALRARVRVDPEPARSGLEHSTRALRRRDRRRVPPRRGAVVSRACSITSARRAARPDGHAGAQRRLAAARLVRRPHRRRAAALGRDRPAPAGRHSSYYGIHDGSICARCHGGAAAATTSTASRNLYTANDAWARQVVHAAQRSRRRPAAHACARVLRQRRARAVHGARCSARRAFAASGRLGRQPRRRATRSLARLAAGEVNVVFSVDLFNEGIDVPLVDTLLMLRPTDSPTLFLQQLGRGLRRAHGKTVCTVLDFVGHHRASSASIAGFGRCSAAAARLERQVERGFPFLPAGCHMELDRVATEIVLAEHPRGDPVPVDGEGRGAARAHRTRQAASRLATLPRGERARARRTSTTARSRGRICATTAGLRLLRRARTRARCARLRAAAARRRQRADRGVPTSASSARSATPPDAGASSTRDHRLLRMLVASLARPARSTRRRRLTAGVRPCSGRIPQVRAELLELLEVLASPRRSHAPAARDTPGRAAPGPCPLHAHRDPRRVRHRRRREGGPWQTACTGRRTARADLLAFTLDKTSGQFSPTTRYRDYAISRELIHWESQSITRADSETGRRYQQHVEHGSS